MKKGRKIQTAIDALFSRFKTLFKKVDADTRQKQKRSYLDDMAIPRENLRSQYGGYNCKCGGGGTFILLLGLMLLVVGCRTKQPTVVEREHIVYVTKDSVINKDSVVYIPIEIYKDYSEFQDTLWLETSLAIAWAWNDTSDWIMKGEIKNKQAVQYKYIEVDKWHTKDSIVEREVPIPYEVEVTKTHIPTWAWLCLGFTILVLGYIGFRIYLHFKGL